MHGEMLPHKRAAFVRFGGRWVPYPFQYHLHHLEVEECVACLVDLARAAGGAGRANFLEWARGVFGARLSEIFMEPYNGKVWRHPLEEMSAAWIAERVATVDVRRALTNALKRQDEHVWGPNAEFGFPASGGTGEIYRRMAARLGERVRLGEEVVGVDPAKRTVRTAAGEVHEYEWLVTTAELDRLVGMSEGVPSGVREAAGSLGHNSLVITGLGWRHPTEHERCWMYFPEAAMPAYRVTNFGHYAAANVPEGRDDEYCSYMCETAFVAGGAGGADAEALCGGLCGGLREAGLVGAGAGPVARWTLRVDHGYPIPTLGRDAALGRVQGWLEERGILSRGRFGAWRYEVGNMDHSWMMGWEAAERIQTGAPEKVVASG
jgi:protoporphyrinogen oxidase